MTPLKQIEEGIKAGNWLIVCQGYESLTGKSLFNTKVHKAKSDEAHLRRVIGDIHKLSSLARVATSIAERKESPVVTVATTASDKNKARFGNEVKLISTEHDEDEIASNLVKAEKASQHKRPREKPPTTKIMCNECGKEFESKIKSGELGQKCSKCLATSIRKHNG